MQHIIKTITHFYPHLEKWWHTNSSLSLQKYFERYFTEKREFPISNSIKKAFNTYLNVFYSQEITHEVIHQLEKYPQILTGNHHSFDIHAFTFQGTLGQVMAHILQERKYTIVLAVGNVSLNNQAYPRGIVLSRDKIFNQIEDNWRYNPIKLNIFPHKNIRSTVSSMPAFQVEQVLNLEKQISSLYANNSLTQKEIDNLQKIVLMLKQKSVMKFKRYSEQITYINSLLWEYLQRKLTHKTQVIFLELEELVRLFLLEELKNSNSFIYQLLFCKELREQVINYLDKSLSCWNVQKLSELLYCNDEMTKKNLLQQCGTLFFWKLNTRGQRIPLFIKDEKFYYQESNTLHSLDFSPENIVDKIDTREFIPNSFLCFSIIALYEGFLCAGGFGQLEYLTNFKNSFLQLPKTFLDKLPANIKNTPTNHYMTGLSYNLTGYNSQYYRCSNLLDSMGEDYLSSEFINTKRKGPVKENFIQGLLEVYPEAIKQREAGWYTSIIDHLKHNPQNFSHLIHY